MKTQLQLAENQTIFIRTINAPREMVFDAWTQAEHLNKWFGPRIFRTEAVSDPRVGGKYDISMIGRDDAPEDFRGKYYTMRGEFLEFMRPERVVYSEDLSEHPDDWKEIIRSNMADSSAAITFKSVTTVEFEKLSESSTKVTIATVFESDDVRDAFVKTGMSEGWDETLDRLDELVAIPS